MSEEKTEFSEVDPHIESIDARYKLNGIHYYRISMEEFYKKITEDPDKYSAVFGDILPACIGGLFRSPRIAHLLEENSFSLTKNKPDGQSLIGLSDMINKASVTTQGKLALEGYKKPVDTLILGLDLGAEEDLMDDGLIAVIVPLIKLQQRYKKTEIKLNIIIVDGDEELSGPLYRKYTKVIDTSDAPPAFPDK